MSDLNFNAVYQNERWTSAGNGSGPGSTIKNTEKIRKFLSNFIRDLKITSIVDVSVGGMNWWPSILERNPSVSFYGYDVSSYIIEKNRDKFKHMNNWFFETCDASKKCNYPTADLILCRHTMQHLSISNSLSILNAMKSSGSKYICLTSHNAIKKNPIKEDGVNLLKNTPGCFKFRGMNVELAPFNMGIPYMSTDDNNEPSQIANHQKLSIWINQH